MNNILVCGGAGYIGSHMIKNLSRSGYQTIAFDNLSQGHRDAVLTGQFIEGDLANIESLERLFSEHSFDLVMHFASSIQVGESVQNPSKYYKNNFQNSQNLLDIMVRHNVLNFVFSSTAAIFGDPEYVPIDEMHPKQPINPYGRSKLMVEEILADYERAYGMKSVCLRYFNAAGADPEGKLGERHDPETHLIPLVLQVASGRREKITIFGKDYDTPDGTCIRDYIHVDDLCSAHMLALEYLMQDGGGSKSYNLGNGNGFSVLEVIQMAEEVCGQPIATEIVDRREGDPSSLVANPGLIMNEFGWSPEHSTLEMIIRHAWLWEQRQL